MDLYDYSLNMLFVQFLKLFAWFCKEKLTLSWQKFEVNLEILANATKMSGVTIMKQTKQNKTSYCFVKRCL